MNTTELKALAEKAPKGRWDVGSYYIWRGDDRWHPVHVQKRGLMAETKTAAMSAWVAAANPTAMLELIAKLEDAQGEIRALRATEAGLREKADRWDFLAPRMLAADFDYLGDGVQALVFEMPNGFSASADAADTIDRARALLEKKE